MQGYQNSPWNPPGFTRKFLLSHNVPTAAASAYLNTIHGTEVPQWNQWVVMVTDKAVRYPPPHLWKDQDKTMNCSTTEERKKNITQISESHTDWTCAWGHTHLHKVSVLNIFSLIKNSCEERAGICSKGGTLCLALCLIYFVCVCVYTCVLVCIANASMCISWLKERAVVHAALTALENAGCWTV